MVSASQAIENTENAAIDRIMTVVMILLLAIFLNIYISLTLLNILEIHTTNLYSKSNLNRIFHDHIKTSFKGLFCRIYKMTYWIAKSANEMRYGSDRLCSLR